MGGHVVGPKTCSDAHACMWFGALNVSTLLVPESVAVLLKSKVYSGNNGTRQQFIKASDG